MNTRAILINGVSLPYHVLDKGIQQAKTGHPMRAVFIYNNEEESEIYIVPADTQLTRAEFTDANARIHLTTLVHHNLDFAKGYFQNKNVDVETVLLPNPTMEEIVDALQDAEKVFIDPDTFNHPEEPAYVSITYEQFDERLSSKLELCAAD